MILFLLIAVRFPRTIKIVSMTSHCHFQHFQKIPWSQNWLKGKLTGNPCYILVVNAIVSSNVFLNYTNQLSRNNPWNIIIFASTSSTNQHVQSSHCFIIQKSMDFPMGDPMEIGTAEATNGTEPSGALARLKAAREVHGAAALQEALQCCAEVPQGLGLPWRWGVGMIFMVLGMGNNAGLMLV